MIALLAGVVVLSLAGAASAAPRFWKTGGSCTNVFTDTNCWAAVSGGATGQSVPGVADTVTFDGNGTGACSLNAPVSVTSIAIAVGYTGTITANSTGGGPDLQTSTTFSQAAGIFNLNASTATIGSTFALTGGTFSAGTGSLTVTTTTTVSNASATFNGGSATLTLTGNVGVTASGNFNAGSGMKTFSAALNVGNGASQGNFNAGSAAISVAGATTIQGSSTYVAGTSTLTLTGSLNVSTATFRAQNSTLSVGTTTTIQATSTFDTTTGITTGSNLTFSGNITITSSTADFTGAASTAFPAQLWASTSSQVLMGPTASVGTLFVRGASALLTCNATNAFTVTGNTTVDQGGELDLVGGTKTFGGTFTLGAAATAGTLGLGTGTAMTFATLTVDEATIDFTGFAPTIAGTLAVNAGGTVTMGSTTTIGTNLNVTGGTFNMGPNAQTVHGTTTINTGGVFTASTGSVLDTFTGTVTVGAAATLGTFNPGTTATLAFSNLTLNEATVDFTHAFATTFTAAVAVDAGGTLTMGPTSTIGTTLTVAGGIMNLGANAQTVTTTTAINTAGTLNASTGSVTDTFTGTVTVGAVATLGTFNPGTTATLAFSNLTLNEATVDFTHAFATTFSAAVAVNVGGTLTMGPASTIGTTLTVAGGIMNLGANAQKVTTTTAINAGGTLNASTGSVTDTFAGTVTVGVANVSSGTFNPGTTATLAFKSFTCVNSTCSLAGALATTFTNNIFVGASGNMTMGPSATVTGTLTVRGASAVFNAGANAQTVTSTTTIDQGGTYNASTGSVTDLFSNTVTIGAVATVGSFSAGTTATLAFASLTINEALVSFAGAAGMTVTGTVTVNVNGTLTMGPTVTIGTNLNVTGGTFSEGANAQAVMGTTTISASGMFTASTGSVTDTFTGLVTVGNAVTPSSGTFNPGTTATLAFGALTVVDSTVSFASAAATTFTGNVIVSASGNLTMGPTATIGGTLTVRGASAVFNAGANGQTVTGATTIDTTGTYNASTGTVTDTFNGLVTVGAAATVGTFNPSSTATLVFAAFTVDEATVSFSSSPATSFSGNVIVNANGSLTMGPSATIGGTLTVTGASSIFNASGNPLTVSGSVTVNTGGVFNANTCANMSLAAGAGSPAVTIGGAATVGTFHAGTATIAFNGTTTTNNGLIIQGGSTFDTAGAALTFGVGMTNGGTNSLDLANGTVDLSNAATTYNFSPGGGAQANVVIAATGTLKLSTATAAFPRSVTTSGTFTSGGGTITVAGGLTISAGTFTASTSAVTVTGNVTLTTGTADFSVTTTGPTFSAAVTQNGGTFTLGSGSATVGNGLNVQGGTFNAASSTLTVTGNSTMNAAGGSTGTFNANTSNTTFNNAVTVGANAISAPTTGAFNCNTATLTFKGAVLVQSTSIFDPGSGSNGINFNTTLTLGNGSSNMNITTGTFAAGSRSGAIIFTGAVAVHEASIFNAGSNGSITFISTVALGATAIPTAGAFNSNSATITFDNTLTLVEGSIFDGGTSHLSLSAVTVGSNAPASQATFNAASTTATFSGALTVEGGATSQFNANASTLQFNGSTTLGNVTAGTFNANSATVTFSGSFTLAVSSAFNGNTGSGSFGATTLTSGTFTVADAGSTKRWTLNQSTTFLVGATLAFPTSGGELSLAPTKTLTIQGPVTSNVTTNATLPKIDCNGCTSAQGITVAFSATSAPNVNGLEFDNSVAAGVSILSPPPYTLKRLKFQNNVGGAGSIHVVITLAIAVINVPGCYFDSTATTNVKLQGTAGPLNVRGARAIFEFQSTAINGPGAGNANDLDGDKAPDASPNDNFGGNVASPYFGSVVEWVGASETDTAGSAAGYPTVAYDWNTFAPYGVYAAYNNATASTDVIWVRRDTSDGMGDNIGAASYSYTISSTTYGTIVGTPWWDTEAGTGSHVVYVAMSSGYLIKLIDSGSGLNPPVDVGDPWDSPVQAADPSTPTYFVASITSPLIDDGTNLYFGGTDSSATTQMFGVQLAGTNAAKLVRHVSSVSAVDAEPSWSTSSGSTYVFLGSTASASVAYIYRVNMTSGVVDTSFSSGLTTSINDSVRLAANNHAYAVDNGGNLHAIDALNFGTGAFKEVSGFPYSTGMGMPITKAAYIESASGVAYFGDGAGYLYAVTNAGTTLNTGYPFLIGAAITSSPVYLPHGGVIAVGASDGNLYFVDRNSGSNVPNIFKRYFVTSAGSVSSVGYDYNSSEYMVSSSDGKLVFVNGSDVVDPTSGTE